MKKLTGIFMALAFMISMVAYGCHASGSVGTTNHLNEKPPAAVR